MKKSRFSEEQIAFALRQTESGTPISEITRKMGIAEQTFYRWKGKYGGMGVAEAQATGVKVVADGELTPEEGTALTNILEARRKAIEIQNHEDRISALEARKNQK